MSPSADSTKPQAEDADRTDAATAGMSGVLSGDLRRACARDSPWHMSFQASRPRMTPKSAWRYVACAKAFGARDEPAVDEADERPEHHVLRQCECHRKPPLVEVDALPHNVEPDAEQRTVQRMDDEAHRPTPTAEKLHVGVVATEDPPVERLLQSPDHRCDSAGSCGTKTRRHTLGACPKGTPFIAPLVACRCSSDSSSRSRHRIHARP